MAEEKRNIEFDKLKADIKQETPGRLYMFFGEESYLREYYLDELRRVLVADRMPEFNLIEFEGEVRFDEISEAVDSYPAMSDRKLVIIRDFDIFKVNEEYRSRLGELFADMPDYCTLVFVYATLQCKPDKRMKLYQTLVKHGDAVEFKRAGRADLIRWIRRRFAALGRDISAELCEYMLFYCGGLMQGLIPEIEKVGAYAKHRDITREDIDAVATPNPEAVVFDLTDAIAERDYLKAMSIVEKLIGMKEEPIVITSLIARQMRQLYTACLAEKHGKGEGEIMRIWGMKSAYPAKRILYSARRISTEWVEGAIRLCLETDEQLKLGSGEDILYYLIARLACDTREVGAC